MTLRNVFASGLLVAGLAAAQSAPSNPPAAHGSQWQNHGPEQLFSQLGLTDAQKTQAQQIFQAAHNNAQTLETQMRSIHQQLATAVKSGAPDSQIDMLANQAGTITGQLTAMHAKAFASFYKILTPDQKAKWTPWATACLWRGCAEWGTVHAPDSSSNDAKPAAGKTRGRHR